MKYRHKTWQSLDSSEQEKYRQLDNERIAESRNMFIEKHLLPGEFEEKYDSDFDKVIAHVEKLLKLRCSQISRSNF